MNPEELRAMIAAGLNLEGMTKEMREQILDEFSQNAMRRATLALFERLPEASRAEFLRLSQAGDFKGLMELVQAHAPDTEEFIRSEVKAELEDFNKRL